MKRNINIYCKNTNTYKEYPMGVTLLDIFKDQKIQMKYQVVAAKVNNKMESLTYEVYRPKRVEFIDIGSSPGMRVYVRTLIMILHKTLKELFPTSQLKIEHPISKGYFCNINNIPDKKITETDLKLIKSRMMEIIHQNLPIHVDEKETKEIISLFSKRNMKDKVVLLETLGETYSEYHRIGDIIDLYNGVLAPSTAYVCLFDLIPYYEGFLLRVPNRQNPTEIEPLFYQKKMYEVFKEYIEWNKITGLTNISDLNTFYKTNKKSTTDLIKISESFHEKKVSHIADEIFSKKNDLRFILISGPSSSGKTTFSKRLAIHLMVNGLKPVTLSLDNYFVNREDTPRDENGNYDYESLYALDLPLFHQQLQDLSEGKTVEIPTFDFIAGKKEYKGETLTVNDNTLIIMEGIHALNPELTIGIPEFMKYKVYVSALTTISLDNHNWIPTSDTRLLRRIIRDYKYRGYSAQDTISRWASVRKGEDEWIFPYQENADAMFNSALLFELSVLKKHAEPILTEVPKNSEEYSEAHRLLKFLQYLIPIKDCEIPPTSLLREFTGGSSFRY